ncbi:MAG: transglutaminase domain-containing protein [Fimbriimonas sp.]
MRILLALCAVFLAGAAWCETSYLGLYMSGSKIGYSSYTASDAKLNGKSVKRNDSLTKMDIGLLGSSMSIQMKSTTWSTAAGKPVQMAFTMESSGRKQDVSAVFNAKTVTVKVNNSGQKSTRTISMPPGSVVDDPIPVVLNGHLKPGAVTTFFVLDPTTISFVKNEVKYVGKGKTKVGNKSYDALIVEINDTRTVTKVFMSAKGDLIRMEGPMGIEMLPVSKAIALAPPGKYAPSVDLAYATSIKTDKPINDPSTLSGLSVRVTAKNLKSVPSGDFQTARQEGPFWLIDVHPPQLDAGISASVEEAAAEKPEWTKPGLYIPSDSAEFKKLAGSIVPRGSDAKATALAIQKWVNKQMKPNAGIGVLRDATEVLKTKEGVCRDYAMLTVTLLRAAGLPAKLASGIVNWDGSFYYHAWAEAWDGSRWLGIDSTTDSEQISAAHVKLGEGDVERAFTFTFLDKAKIEVLGMKRD